ncbi:MAG: cobalt transporter CbiM [Actinomycetota bacterium]|nr:cobalt transporter CbiM [Actinomycetota bacterium]MCL6093936.1 cobalt transporter CbiM [Actinomycetota bacterium]MDA8166825.1 cobalt transporter CbiM [Actinomycetota bacterium]
MHIPDGYISPQTAGGLWAMMVPVWYTAGHKVKRTLRQRQAPLVAIGAAFTFVIMMFNIPVPGGTSAHAVGGTLVAVTLGPWAAVIALTVALVIQALFFGDGGILAIGANCFNMAFILPIVGYYVYRLISAGSSPRGARRWIGAGIGAYVGLNVSAFLVALEVGIQPGLFHTANGTALYSPYGLSQTIPAMMLVHLTVIGFVEAGVTALAVVYLQRARIGLLAGEKAAAPAAGPRLRPLLIGLLLMLIFVPLGLLATATAWGEWSPEDIRRRFGFIPEGMNRFSGFWSGILPHYGVRGSFWSSVPGYMASAAIGLAIVGGLTFLAVKLIHRTKKSD